MKNIALSTRIVLLVLAALLTALPLAQTASPVEAKKRTRTVTREFSNRGVITIPAGPTVPSPGSAAGGHPAVVQVAGMKGKIRDVNVTLNAVSHAFPDELQVLLVGPGGQTAVVMANVGGFAAVNDITLRLDDEATEALEDTTTLRGGTFRPANAGGTIAFNNPAPAAGPNAALSVFDGGTPNGQWLLFVQDEYGPGFPGAIGDGWEIEIQTQFTVKKKKTRR